MNYIIIYYLFLCLSYFSFVWKLSLSYLKELKNINLQLFHISLSSLNNFCNIQMNFARGHRPPNGRTCPKYFSLWRRAIAQNVRHLILYFGSRPTFQYFDSYFNTAWRRTLLTYFLSLTFSRLLSQKPRYTLFYM